MCVISQNVWVRFQHQIISGTTEMIPLPRTEESKDAGHTETENASLAYLWHVYHVLLGIIFV